MVFSKLSEHTKKFANCNIDHLILSLNDIDDLKPVLEQFENDVYEPATIENFSMYVIASKKVSAEVKYVYIERLYNYCLVLGMISEDVKGVLGHLITPEKTIPTQCL